ncbi:hypothetical protein RF007C_10760 [Ruminococcus flavefaciens 007c]|uniref:Uncharacterized protein n=1 Tax=Ruminococcus flavefaciens 007c TaxID=1341157 RepID=W7V1E6_RUMFL|nr:hypothetical protein RF007C_10760 [Ruminococcus flavefaciens 007c]
MLVQRAHGAENGAKNRLANGPLRVQSNERYAYEAVQSILRR